MTELALVTGFFTADEVPMSDRVNGQWLNGFASTEAFKRVQAGYACGQCLAKFAMYMAKCPLCGVERDVAADVKANPAGWQEHWTEHHYGSGATVPRTETDFLRDIHNDPSIEQIPLSKLGPVKHGRGRPKS